MRVVIKPTYEELSKWAADYVVFRINKHRPTPRKPFVLGLPSGVGRCLFILNTT